MNDHQHGESELTLRRRDMLAGTATLVALGAPAAAAIDVSDGYGEGGYGQGAYGGDTSESGYGEGGFGQGEFGD
ncbi:hypothetical protein [Halapricum hydrolyticum]|uniref:Uncharacterized protein n=1 Tax=Halapricum hydrolyticum TaxID=2979991 RepID=A0AAE3IA16_9EURY|nr:hypothetical protein [Halapricum hydrolyticum]MCU4718217.1 hypothetical protein [Halapricum hydrolyticum]MCU4726342.1 hypothetical protein [Halapricum hydrolyticum]